MSVFKRAVPVLMFVLLQSIEAFAADQSICNPGSKVELYPNGSLMSCLLKDEFPSNGIKCKEFQPIRFYPDGQLQSCNLAAAATVDGQECEEFAPISFYPDGKFKSCVKTE